MPFCKTIEKNNFFFFFGGGGIQGVTRWAFFRNPIQLWYAQSIFFSYLSRYSLFSKKQIRILRLKNIYY